MSSNYQLADRPEWQDLFVVIYDGECPFCERYVRYQRLRVNLRERLLLIDARTRPELVEEFDLAGLALDDGMVLIVDRRVYYGAECINRLAMLSSGVGLFNKLNAIVFRSPALSRLFYPTLRAGRRAALWCLGRAPLRSQSRRGDG